MELGLAPFFAIRASGVTIEICHERALAIMEFSSAGTNKNIEEKQKGRRKREMSDVALARSLVRDIGGPGRVNEVLYAAYKRLQRMFPHEQDNFNKWTENRLKGWWYGTSKHVYHWQMRELYEAAAKAKEERELVAAARKEHAEFIAKTARLAALLEHADEAFHSAQIEAMGQQSRRMGLSRIDGDR